MDRENNNAAVTDGDMKKKNRSFRLGLIWFLIVIFTVGGTITGVSLFVARSLQPVEAGAPEVMVTIPYGVGSGRIAEILEQNGIIRNALIFEYYLKWKKEGSSFKAGDYLMQYGMNLDEIIAKLNKGDILREHGIRLTIPEGFTVQQIAARLSAMGYGAIEEVMEQLEHHPADELDLPFIIDEQPDTKHRLEGYLFPETYELKKEATVADIINIMLQQTGKKLALLPENWREELEKRELTFHQLLTIASLIEREAVLEEERPIIAGVIYNRLRIGQPLQIDATVQYSLAQPKERLFNTDLQVESPYNTYLHKGLPPGPIASPSLSSLEAALYPAETTFFYYVTKKDGSRGHLFAETYDQHRANIRESEKNTR